MVIFVEERSCTTQFELGELFYKDNTGSRDFKQAYTWYRNAAINGSRQAQHCLGTMYARGQGVVQDYAKAYAWCKVAVFQNSRRAKRKLKVIETKMSLQQLRRGRWLAQDYYDKLITRREEPGAAPPDDARTGTVKAVKDRSRLPSLDARDEPTVRRAAASPD